MTFSMCFCDLEIFEGESGRAILPERELMLRKGSSVGFDIDS
jgi:hypothetical protein